MGKSFLVGLVLAVQKEEAAAYSALRDRGESNTEAPKNAHIDRLSYTLESGDKRFRFFATYHLKDMQTPEDPNMKQYDVLEDRFIESPPQAVIIEGNI